VPLAGEHAVVLVRHEELKALGQGLAVLAVKRLSGGAEVGQTREARDRQRIALAPRAVLGLVLAEPFEALVAGGLERFGVVVRFGGLTARRTK
jgi:hypothetical protein